MPVNVCMYLLLSICFAYVFVSLFASLSTSLDSRAVSLSRPLSPSAPALKTRRPRINQI